MGSCWCWSKCLWCLCPYFTDSQLHCADQLRGLSRRLGAYQDGIGLTCEGMGRLWALGLKFVGPGVKPKTFVPSTINMDWPSVLAFHKAKVIRFGPVNIQRLLSSDANYLSPSLRRGPIRFDAEPKDSLARKDNYAEILQDNTPTPVSDWIRGPHCIGQSREILKIYSILIITMLAHVASILMPYT